MTSRFVRVVPAIRTPPGVEVFDYRAPDGMELVAGDLVLVPFRRQATPAVVIAKISDSPFATKAADVIGSYAGIRFPDSLVALLDWTAARTFSSKPAVLKSWLRSLPRRPPTASAPATNIERQDGRFTAHWTITPQTELLAAAKASLAEGRRVLILTPWLTRAVRLQRGLTDCAVLHSGQNDGDAFRAWHGFLTGKIRCLVATRLGAWLAPLADVVLVDEPENDDHKQDELAPRYDARVMAAWCAKHGGVTVESFGTTPPLSVTDDAPAIPAELRVHVRHPQGRSRIPMLQADTLLALKEHDGPRVIIHPIRGMAARLVCRDCGWRATCERCGFELSAETDHAVCRRCGKKTSLPLSCPSCGGADLGKSLPGIERLKSAWAKQEPELAVLWRDLSNEAMDAPFALGSLVVVTDANLLGGAGEDIRRKERQAVAFRRLAARVAAAHGRLVIQCDEAHAGAWQAWLTREGIEAFRAEERKQRELFGYPPAVRLVKALVDGDELASKLWQVKAEQLLKPLVTFHGPWPVAHRPKSRPARFVWHLVFPKQMTEAQLVDRLTPLAGSAILDLDPIAFFK